MVVFEKTVFIPFWRIAIAFIILAILTYPKIRLFWVYDLKTTRGIKDRLVTVWFRFLIRKQPICVCFNSEDLVYTAYRET